VLLVSDQDGKPDVPGRQPVSRAGQRPGLAGDGYGLRPELMDQLNAAAKPTVLLVVLLLVAYAVGHGTYEILVRAAVRPAGVGGRFEPLPNPDAADCAQLAETLLVQRKYNTKVVLPITYQRTRTIVDHPEISRPPVFPLLEAAYFQLRYVHIRNATTFTIIIFVLCVAAVYVVGTTWYGRFVGLTSAALFALSRPVVELAVSGRPLLLCALWVMIAFWFLSPRRKRDPSEPNVLAMVVPSFVKRAVAALSRPGPRAVFGGLLIGLCYLTDTFYGWLILPAALMARPVGGGRRRWLTAGLCVLAFLVLAVPWWVRSASLTGSPFFSLGRYAIMENSPDYPGSDVYRTFESVENPWIYSITHPVHTCKFMVASLASVLEQGGAALVIVLLPFFVLWYLAPAVDDVEFRRRRALLGFIAVIVVVALTQTPGAQRLVPLLPLMFVCGVWTLLRALSGFPQRARRGLVLAAALLAALPIGSFVTTPPTPLSESWMLHLSRSNSVFIRKKEQKTVRIIRSLLTDVPWYVAWYAKQPAMLVPRAGEGLRTLDAFFDRSAPVVWGVYVSCLTETLYPGQDFRNWTRLRRAPAGMVLVDGYRIHDLHELLDPPRLRQSLFDVLALHEQIIAELPPPEPIQGRPPPETVVPDGAADEDPGG